MSQEDIHPLLGRPRRAHWAALDAAASLVLCAGILFEGVPTMHAANRPIWQLAALAALASLPLAGRRRRPIPVLGIVLVAALGLSALDVSPLINVGYALYAVASLTSTRRAVVALLAVGAFVAVGLLVVAPPPRPLSRVESSAVTLALFWAVGFGMRQQRAHAEAVAAQAARSAQEQLAAERMRIARELHDVVAHSMSLITMQAGVAHYVIEQRPQDAGPALASIESTSRAAMAEMRRLLDVLRATDDAPAGIDLAPAPGLAALQELASATARAGVQVEIEVQGQPRELPAGVDLAAYRIVQESLTNVIKHARTGHSRVLVVYEPEALRVEVTDRGRGTAPGGSGHGLVGMRERVALYGGEVSTGPLPGSGYRVAARLPAEPVSAEALPVTGP